MAGRNEVDRIFREREWKKGKPPTDSLISCDFPLATENFMAQPMREY
jgi:hypothetical protein